VAVQLKYYFSDAYKRVRNFECGDTLHLRMMELAREFDLATLEPERLLNL